MLIGPNSKDYTQDISLSYSLDKLKNERLLIDEKEIDGLLRYLFENIDTPNMNKYTFMNKL